MEYTFVERQPNHRGSNWFGHQIELYVSTKKKEELFEFLTTSFGPRGKSWRIAERRAFSILDDKRKSTLRFMSKSDALRFKLSWDEEPQPESYMDLIRKLTLNSNYGGISRGFATTMAPPANPLPWYDINSLYAGLAIPPSTGKTNIFQAKGRGLNNACKEIVLLDYEASSHKWWHEFYTKCDSWMTYTMLLNDEVREEELSASVRTDNLGSDEAKVAGPSQPL